MVSNNTEIESLQLEIIASIKLRDVLLSDGIFLLISWPLKRYPDRVLELKRGKGIIIINCQGEGEPLKIHNLGGKYKQTFK